jgi:hypothetical protein
LPDWYNPEKDLVDTLKVVVDSTDSYQAAEVAKKVRGGMNRDQFREKKNENNDGEKEYYFDCTILDKLETNKAAQ